MYRSGAAASIMKFLPSFMKICEYIYMLLEGTHMAGYHKVLFSYRMIK
jgi:hypothetical protein